MRARGLTAVALVAVALSGCGSTRLLLRRSSSSPPPASSTHTTASQPPAVAARRYLAQLRAEEQQLAAAERRIPTSANTPQALSHSASLLAAAASRLANGLSAITPPPSVAAQHAQLVAIVRLYAQRLRNAAATAMQPNGAVRADMLLVSATNRASTEFNRTLAKIYSTLGVHQP